MRQEFLRRLSSSETGSDAIACCSPRVGLRIPGAVSSVGGLRNFECHLLGPKANYALTAATSAVEGKLDRVAPALTADFCALSGPHALDLAIGIFANVNEITSGASWHG
jgi:hypothetical protein